MSPEKASARKKREKDQIVDEKAETAELPPGWTKEVKVRKSGSTTKRDVYMKDPATGCIFRSLKDVHRYLKTGKVGRLAQKPKDISSCVDMDVEDENVPTQAGGDQMAGQRISSSDKMENEGRTMESTCTEDCSRVSENASELCMENDEVSGVKLPKFNKSEEIEVKGNASSKGACGMDEREEKTEPKEKILPTPTRRSSRHERPLENGSGHSKTDQSSEKTKPALPRRASKRLAGIDVDVPSPPPLAEPKTRGQARTRQAETITAADLTTPRKRVKKVSTARDKQVTPSPSEAMSTPEKRAGEAEKISKLGDRQDSSLTAENEHARDDNMDSKPTEEHDTAINLPPINLPTIKDDYEEAKVEDDKAAADEEAKAPVPPSTCKEHDKEIEDVKAAADEEAKALFAPSTCKEHDKGMEDVKAAADEAAKSPVTPSTCKEHDEEMEDVKGGTDEDAKASLPPSTCKEQDKEIKIEHRSNEKQVSLTTLPPVSLTTPEGYKSSSKTDIDNPEENQVLPVIVTPVSLEMGKDDEQLVSPPCPEDSYGGVKPGPSVEFSLNDLWTDPCIEFAVKTLTGDIPIEESNKVDKFPTTSQLQLPLEELWTDPCIEFAVKTLTGAIPVEQDLCVQDYLQNQPSNSSQTLGENNFTLPDISGNNFCQTEFLSKHYETTENSVRNKQQDMTPSTMAPNHQSNFSLQNSGRQVNGNGFGGQCSEQRFFQ